MVRREEDANRRTADAATTNEAHGGMATTVTALLLSGDRAALVHVGDSRAYRLRNGELEQLTTDHTYVQWLVDRGMLEPEEARHHPRRSVVTQVVQGEAIRTPGGTPVGTAGRSVARVQRRTLRRG